MGTKSQIIIIIVNHIYAGQIRQKINSVIKQYEKNNSEKILHGAKPGAQVTKYMCDLQSSRIEFIIYRTKH